MKAVPNVYKNVLLENDQVRVIQIEFAPGETAAWHLSFEIHTGDPMDGEDTLDAKETWKVDNTGNVLSLVFNNKMSGTETPGTNYYDKVK